MAADPGKNNTPEGDSDQAKMKRVLIPALAVGLIVILAAVIAGITDQSGRKMSDGSDGTPDDPGLVLVESGVKYRDVKEGTGEPCPDGSKVKVNYKGWLTDGTVFDSNKDKSDKPVEFDLAGGPGPVLIRGWTVGIPGMKPGGIRKLVVYPEKGYGNQQKGKIPPNSVLIFEIELVSVTPGPRARRSPPPADLTKLADGTLPTASDPDLKPIGDKGLKYRDIKEGTGPEVTPGGSVKVDYIGWRLSDGKMFDSSWKPEGRPFDASTAGGVIRGWMEGIPGMKLGGIRKLVIPPDLAYGGTGAGDDIPPNATLVFEIELLQVK